MKHFPILRHPCFFHLCNVIWSVFFKIAGNTFHENQELSANGLLKKIGLFPKRALITKMLLYLNPNAKHLKACVLYSLHAVACVVTESSIWIVCITYVLNLDDTITMSKKVGNVSTVYLFPT